METEAEKDFDKDFPHILFCEDKFFFSSPANGEKKKQIHVYCTSKNKMNAYKLNVFVKMQVQ